MRTSINNIQMYIILLIEEYIVDRLVIVYVEQFVWPNHDHDN